MARKGYNTLTCHTCKTKLFHPENASFIQCPKCQDTMNLQSVSVTYMNCIGCSVLISHPASTTTIQCPKCRIIMELPAKAPETETTGRKMRKKKRDPYAPKRASNAYMIFCKEKRAELKKSRPDLPFGQLGASLGEIWRKMPVEEKKPFENRAFVDRERYHNEMAIYHQRHVPTFSSMKKENGGNPDNANNPFKRPCTDQARDIMRQQFQQLEIQQDHMKKTQNMMKAQGGNQSIQSLQQRLYAQAQMQAQHLKATQQLQMQAQQLQLQAQQLQAQQLHMSASLPPNLQQQMKQQAEQLKQQALQAQKLQAQAQASAQKNVPVPILMFGMPANMLFPSLYPNNPSDANTAAAMKH